MRVEITALAGLGDGVGELGEKKLFVPYSVAGDVVEVEIARQTRDADYAKIKQIITPSPHRIPAVCQHFTDCGGCTLQHLETHYYAAFKHKMACKTARKAGFSGEIVQDLVVIPSASRRRVEVKIKDGKIGFARANSHEIIDIKACDVVEPALFQLIQALKPYVTAYSAITAIHINGVKAGYDVVLDVTEIPPLAIPKLPRLLRLSIRHQGVITLIKSYAPVVMRLGQVDVSVPAGAFLQASHMAQTILTELVVKEVGYAKSVMDLFAGIGTYSFPLLVPHKRKIHAIEGDKAMVVAMNEAITKQSLKTHIKASVRDLFQNPVSILELKGIDAVVINPPRLGAKLQSEQLAQSSVPFIVMVSCNPATFTRDARILKEGWYQLTTLTPLDPFVYSSHVELVAVFRKKE